MHFQIDPSRFHVQDWLGFTEDSPIQIEWNGNTFIGLYQSQLVLSPSGHVILTLEIPQYYLDNGLDLTPFNVASSNHQITLKI